MGQQVSSVGDLISDTVSELGGALLKPIIRGASDVMNFAEHPSWSGAARVVRDAAEFVAPELYAVEAGYNTAVSIGDRLGVNLDLSSIASSISMGAAVNPGTAATTVIDRVMPSIAAANRGNYNIKTPGPNIKIDVPVLSLIAPIDPGYSDRIDKNKSLPNQVNVENDQYYMQNSGVDKNSIGSSGGRKRTFAMI